MNEILDSLGEGVFTVDKEFRVTFLNRAAEKLLGEKREGAVGRSKAITEIFDLIMDIKESDAPVVIQGETGTGKELVANRTCQGSIYGCGERPGRTV